MDCIVIYNFFLNISPQLCTESEITFIDDTNYIMHSSNHNRLHIYLLSHYHMIIANVVDVSVFNTPLIGSAGIKLYN